VSSLLWLQVVREHGPAGVIRPSASRRRAFSRLVADQFDPGRRGTNRIA